MLSLIRRGQSTAWKLAMAGKSEISKLGLCQVSQEIGGKKLDNIKLATFWVSSVLVKIQRINKTAKPFTNGPASRYTQMLKTYKKIKTVIL